MEAVQHSVYAILQSPQVVYRTEFGADWKVTGPLTDLGKQFVHMALPISPVSLHDGFGLPYKILSSIFRQYKVARLSPMAVAEILRACARQEIVHGRRDRRLAHPLGAPRCNVRVMQRSLRSIEYGLHVMDETAANT